MKQLIIFLNILSIFSSVNFALAQELESDRPDFTEGTLTQTPGRLQLESGYTYTKHNGGSDDHALPELLIRAGLVEGSELRISWDGIIWSGFEDDSDSGSGDMSIGAKTKILSDLDGSNMSVIYELGLPVGSNEYSADGVEPAAKLLFAKDLSDRFGLSGNINLSSLNGDEERYFELGLSTSLGIRINEQVGSYIEAFSLVPLESVIESDEHYLNGGLTYLINEDLQIDVRVGFGINSAASDLFAGAGIVVRL